MIDDQPRPPVATQIGWAAVFLVASLAIQLMQPVPWDADTAYHLAVARLIREHGLLEEFPWTTQSWFAEHYADKELLFHLLLVPVADLRLGLAGKIAGTLFPAAVLWLFFRLLVIERVRRPGLWALLVLVCSGAFLVRFTLLRPHVLSLGLSLLVVWAAARRRWVWLAATCFLFPLSYVAWHLTIILVGLVETARLLSGQRPEWRTLAIAVGATGVGLLVHPNFPENVQLTWLHVKDILVEKAWGDEPGFVMGGELNPFSLKGLGRYVLIPALLLAAGLVAGWKDRRRDVLPLAAGLVGVGFLAMTLKSQRFIEYLVPFAALAAALALRERLRDRVVALAVLIALLFTALVGRRPVMALSGRTDMFPPEVEAAVQDLIPPGEQVFTCGWQLTGEMMLALPQRRFLVALDPVLFFRKDPELYRLWYALVHAPPERPASLIRDRFKARYVLCEERPQWSPFFYLLSRDPDARMVMHDRHWLVFRLEP